MAGEPTPIDQRMVKSIAHPTRMRILTLLNQKTASPVELAENLGEPLGNVSYHVRILLELGSIELVNTVPRRGALEHYYRAVERPWFNAADWQRLPESARRSVSDTVLAQVWKEIGEATKEGLFDARADRHLSRTTLLLDGQGWEQVRQLLDEALERVLEIQREAAVRLADPASQEDATSSAVVFMHYNTPHQGGR
jgi:DNA-binding transcriptional ArsR family regulator